MTRTMMVLALSTIGLAGCASVDRTPDNCRDKTVVLNYARGSIGINPNDYVVEMCSGNSLKVKLVGPGIHKGGARTKAKQEKNPQPAPWLSRTNLEGDFILIKVPGSVAVDEAYHYYIYVDGVGMLDPVIRIIQQ
jgi:hypothetical protein